MNATTVTRTLPFPGIARPLFGDVWWIVVARVDPVLPPNRAILRAARVTVHRTPLYEIVGDPDPVDVHEIVGEEPDGPDEDDWRDVTMADVLMKDTTVIDHDPLRYVPYTDLICFDPGIATDCYLVEV